MCIRDRYRDGLWLVKKWSSIGRWSGAMNNFTRAVTMAIPATAVLLASAAGAASAYWTDSDAGTGTVTTGASASIAVGPVGRGNPGPTYVTAVTATGYTIDVAHV